MCELKCERTPWVSYSRITFKRARLGGVQFFSGVRISCFLKIWRRTGDESVLLLWRSRPLPKASVSLPSSLIFPEPQARIDFKNLTWCLFGGVIEGYHIFFLILRFCLARILFTYICLLEKMGTIAFFRLFEYILSLL